MTMLSDHMTMPDRYPSARSVAGTILHTIGTESQQGKVLLHLIKRGSITQVEAHELYRIYRLAARIHDLKNLGVNIARTEKVDLTGTRYVEYSLEGCNGILW